MEIKPIKLSPKRGGNGYISSYTVNLGCSEIRDAGFIDMDGNLLPVEKLIDTDNKEIIIRLRAED